MVNLCRIYVHHKLYKNSLVSILIKAYTRIWYLKPGTMCIFTANLTTVQNISLISIVVRMFQNTDGKEDEKGLKY